MVGRGVVHWDTGVRVCPVIPCNSVRSFLAKGRRPTVPTVPRSLSGSGPARGVGSCVSCQTQPHCPQEQTVVCGPVVAASGSNPQWHQNRGRECPSWDTLFKSQQRCRGAGVPRHLRFRPILGGFASSLPSLGVAPGPYACTSTRFSTPYVERIRPGEGPHLLQVRQR